MIRNPDIEYIDKFYVHGSEAKVIEFAPKKAAPRTILPKSFREKTAHITIDPVAVCGLAVAVVMLIVMIVGMVDFRAACEENRAASEYLQEVRDRNVMLQFQYHSGYDVTEVKEAAHALGMVSASEVPVISISVSVPEVEEKYTPWGDFLWSLSCLFSE